MEGIETSAREFARVWTDDPSLAMLAGEQLTCLEFAALEGLIASTGGDASQWATVHRSKLFHDDHCKGASP